MNLLHMKYAVEVARLGSLSKAAEVLLTAQPNISRAVKELETDLGIRIFSRSPKGMTLTPEGEAFIRHASQILRQIDELELIYRGDARQKRRFTLSAPRAGYISEAIADFSRRLGDEPLEIFFRETNTKETLDNVLSGDYKLGIVRYAARHDRSFKAMLEEKGLTYELVTEFTYVLLMSREHSLAEKPDIAFSDLIPFVEVAHADPRIPALPLAKEDRDERPDQLARRIFVFDRAGQFDLLAGNHETFMWVSPVSSEVLDRYGLCMRFCPQNDRVYKDVLIYRADGRLSKEDLLFITALCDSKRRHFRFG